MIVVVSVDPPRPGLVLSSLVESTPLTDTDAVALYEAAVTDTLRAAEQSGGEVLLNYRDEDTLPAEFGDNIDTDTDTDADTDAEAEIRTLAADALESVAAADSADDAPVRFERQVGSTHAARIGNTVTHLLEREGADAVGVLEPTVPLVARTEIDGAAMSLRRHDTVIGPSSNGRAYFAGFSEPIDFTDAYETPAVSTLATQAAAADHRIGFAPMLPTIGTEAGLCATLAMLEARKQAGRLNAEATATVVSDLGLSVGDDEQLERS
ncbi:uncharacterized protein Nmag_3340 [Natrialba magadii ATCC 43099]|uniref:DUF2064 domain-containing protein n=1 Tax=Natrialba magadii (strain ATCC 43099 / DSM 3394 / CCM 3739 / CIP 104546 / IAM 13178 / JCM 8861 / NBRC 102185 / NCIMB 2190 / MS3) TaxID=547559 RepID=D3SSP5_NATMM|nr:hypothetical protein [Natrialba magadii]ADD06890.1 uncharacterized protein Nmag_3340 [Natrialba magadii ATCC 43099]ELY28385.1 hypothetical protein C500_13527 [Natrialba magadii ATCC 43099]